MNIQYKDEKIGKITDREVIFNNGETYSLAEISYAKEDLKENLDAGCTVFSLFFVLAIVFGFLVTGIGSGWTGTVIFILFLSAMWGVVILSKIYSKICRPTISLYAKGERLMYTYKVKIGALHDGERCKKFVEQINRFVH